MKKVFLILLALMLAVSLSVVSCTTPAEEEEEEEEEPEEILLKWGGIAPENYPGTIAVKNWQNKITEETDGVVQWENYFGTLLSPTDAYSEIQAGVVDVGSIVALYEPVGFTIAKTWGGFFIGANSMDVQVQVSNDLREMFPEIDAEYSGVKLLSNGSPNANYQLQTTNVPVDSIEDLEGLQIKCPTQYIPALATLGASGVVMSMFDVYSSLQTGVLDGAIAQSETLKSLNLADVIKYHTTIDLAVGINLCDGMNWDIWNSLPSDIQQVFEDNKQFLTDEYERLIGGQTEEGITYGIDAGVQFLELSPEALEEFNDAIRVEVVKSAETLDDLGLPGTEMYEEAQRLIAEYQT